MKKRYIIAILIIVLISFFTGYGLCFYKFNKKINNIEKEKQNDDLEDTYKHPIDINEEKCISETNSLYYYICVEKAIDEWDKEIRNQLIEMKKIMKKSDYEYIISSQTQWELSLNKDIIIINKFITNRDGLINKTIRTSQISELKKRRALLLQEVYDNYKDEKEINTITFDDFLYSDTPDKWKKTKINLKGDVEYNNKIVLNKEGLPLNNDTANNTIEIITVLNAEGIEPEPGCNLYDSGTIGCYVYYLYEGMEKNYWKNPSKLKNVITYKKPYNKSKFITFLEFIESKEPNKYNKLKFNNNGDLIYKNKIVLNDRGQTVNNKYEYSTPEFNVIIGLGDVYPNPNCNENNQEDKVLGCYKYYIKDGKARNYWEAQNN